MISAGSVVVKDVKPHELLIGNPAVVAFLNIFQKDTLVAMKNIIKIESKERNHADYFLYKLNLIIML